MANSVPVTGLVAEAVFGAVELEATSAANPCLPYLTVSKYQWFAATTNSRNSAVQIGETLFPFFRHSLAAQGTTYYYWAKTVDQSGAVSDFYPTGTTSGVTGTPKAANSLSLTMSTPAIVIPAAADGTVSSWATATSTAKVLDGVTDDSANWSYTVNPVGVTVSTSVRTVSVTAMAADGGYFDVQATRTGYPTLTARVTVAKARAGQTGEAGPAGYSAESIQLTASSQLFRVTAAGANSPDSITFTVTLLGGLVGTPTFSIAAGTATLTGSGATRTLSYANMATDTVTVQASLNGLTDYVTVAKLREATGPAGTPGAAAVVAILSNDSHVLQASSTGSVTVYTTAVTTMSVFEGLEDVTSLYTFTKSDNGTGSTLTGSTVQITSLVSDTGRVDITASRSGYPSITKRFSLVKARNGPQGTQGTAGTNAAALFLGATSQVFQVSKTGAISPASITLTAQPAGGLTGVATWTVTSGTATLTGTTDNIRTLTFANMGSDAVTIQAAIAGYSDTMTLVKLREGTDGTAGTPGAAGEDALVMVLSNEAHTLAASSTGTVASFAGAVSTVKIYSGITDVTNTYTLSKTDTNVTSTLSAGTITITAMSADSGYVDVNATRSGYPTLTKRMTLSKATAGLQGSTGNTGSQGVRGSKQFYVSGHSVWSDTAANTASNVQGGKQLNDVVTLYNSTSYSETRFWNGTSWVVITQVIDGNLLVTGSVGATKISASYVYAGAIDASQVTAGTFTGRTFQTAASGKRVVIDAAASNMIVYDASNNIVARLGGTTDGGIWGVSVSGSALSAFGAVVQGSQHGYYATSTGTASGSCFYAAPNISSRGLEILKAAANAVPAAEIRTTGGTGNSLYLNHTGSSGMALYSRSTNVGSHAICGENTAVLNSVTGGLGYLGLNPGAGAFGVYAGRGGVAPFTGQHDALIEKSAVIEPGDIVVDVELVAKVSINDAITRIDRSSAHRQTSVIGVFVSRRPYVAETSFVPAGLVDRSDTGKTDEDGNAIYRERLCATHVERLKTHDLAVINSLGEGLVNVCGEGGDIKIGDLIVSSSMPGKGCRQSDGIIRSVTVAKAREAVKFSSPTEIRQIACIYYCG